MKRITLFALISMVLLTGCGMTNEPELTPVKLTMGYIPNIQFAPLYVADSRGYFKDEGIAIEFAYMDENQATALVGANNLQFAIISGEQVLLARAQELPVVYVAAWYQQYPVSVISLTDQGVKTPADLRGMSIGLPGLYGANYIGLRALLHAGGLGEGDVSLDSIGYTQVESLVTGRDQAVSVYTANEPVQLRARGYELNELRVADYVELASNGLVTNESVAKENPRLVRGMAAAILRGIAETTADPEAAYQVSLAYVENLGQADAEVQMEVLRTSISLWQAEQPGFSRQAAWENMQMVLLEMGLLSQPLDLASAFSNEFLPK